MSQANNCAFKLRDNYKINLIDAGLNIYVSSVFFIGFTSMFTINMRVEIVSVTQK